MEDRRLWDGMRHETPAEKLDRNWNDLLQELRVMQTGTQIVAAFLIVLPFQARFEELAGDKIGWYAALLLAAVLLTTLMLVPVVIHRRLFGRHVKDQTVAWGNLLVKICLAGQGVLLAGCVTFIAHAVLDPVPAWWIAGAIAAVIALLMLALPPRRVHAAEEDGTPERPSGPPNAPPTGPPTGPPPGRPTGRAGQGSGTG